MMLEYLFLATAAFLAGLLNTVAGGGTFLTFPALVYTGMPIVVANTTSAVAVLPGYLGGTVGFRTELAELGRERLVKTVCLAALGGLVGSLSLIVSSNETFSAVVPFLLMAATAVFAFGPRIQDWARGSRFSTKPEGALGTVLVSFYGGYFNGGLGVVLLALFSFWGMREINTMNGLKSALSFVLSLTSTITFAVAGMVAWPQAIIMMAAATAGGYVGAPIGRLLPHHVIRTTVIVVGVAMSAVFFVRMAVRF